METHRITADTGAGPNLIRSDLIPENCKDLIVPRKNPNLIGASGKKLAFRGVVPLCVRIQNLKVRIHFGVVDELPPGTLLGTAFIDTFVKNIDPPRQLIHFFRSEPAPILAKYRQRASNDKTKRSYKPQTNTIESIAEPKPTERNDEFPDIKEEVAIRLAKRTTIPANHFKLVTVHCPHSGFVTIKPHWRCQHNMTVLAANGIAEIKHDRSFRIWVGNFTDKPVTMPKRMRVGLAAPPPLFVANSNFAAGASKISEGEEDVPVHETMPVREDGQHETHNLSPQSEATGCAFRVDHLLGPASFRELAHLPPPHLFSKLPLRSSNLQRRVGVAQPSRLAYVWAW